MEFISEKIQESRPFPTGSLWRLASWCRSLLNLRPRPFVGLSRELVGHKFRANDIAEMSYPLPELGGDGLKTR